jgi:hypothetical protein
MVSLLNVPAHYARRCYDLNAMEFVGLKAGGMSCEYYRAQAARVRRLAEDATTEAIREHLAEVARQYEELAGGADPSYRNPE